MLCKDKNTCYDGIVALYDIGYMEAEEEARLQGNTMLQGNLDDKLKEITVVLKANSDNRTLSDGTIAQIKQAFADTGYRNVASDNLLYYSGQVWFDRFEKEIWRKDNSGDTLDPFWNKVYLKAAKKAAGLE